MKSWFAMVFLLCTIISEMNAQARRRTRPPSTAELVENCITSGCACCYTQNTSEVLCLRENSNMPEINTIWGELSVERIRGKEFRFYNFNEEQKSEFREAFQVIPDNYIPALPVNLRVGHPRTGSLVITERIRSDTEDKIGGGARRCHIKNDLYDFIIIDPRAFNDRTTPVKLTILHEIGHFVDREYNLAEAYIRQYRTEFSNYLSHYRGHSSSNGEVIAQGIGCYHYRKNWATHAYHPPDRVSYDLPDSTLTQSGRFANPVGTPFPLWLRSIIRHHLGVEDIIPPTGRRRRR
ncbi:MAG: hypothetical protein IPM34_05845 [Saprospiraceae bacterium]|nr:hypothetical protein [Saprospiraceae bacterium]